MNKLSIFFWSKNCKFCHLWDCVSIHSKLVECLRHCLSFLKDAQYSLVSAHHLKWFANYYWHTVRKKISSLESWMADMYVQGRPWDVTMLGLGAETWFQNICSQWDQNRLLYRPHSQFDNLVESDVMKLEAPPSLNFEELGQRKIPWWSLRWFDCRLSLLRYWLYWSLAVISSLANTLNRWALSDMTVFRDRVILELYWRGNMMVSLVINFPAMYSTA